MSWLSDATNWLGSAVGAGSLGDDISSWFDPSDIVDANSVGSIFDGPTSNIPSSSVVNPSGFVGGGSGGFSLGDLMSGNGKTPSLWPSIIGAGTSLAGTYFGQSGAKDSAEAFAQAQANQIAAEKEMDEKRLANAKDIANIYAGSSAGSARRSTLASLYNNWAQLKAQGGANQAAQALGTGKAMTDGINARAAVLK